MKNKLEELKEFIRKQSEKGILIALSAGVDSSTLAAVTYQVAGEHAAAATAISSTYPEQKKEAEKIAKEIGINHYFIETNELHSEQFIRNPLNRCYFCKRHLITSLRELATKLGFEVIFEGTTKSDLSGHRPGYEAIKEAEKTYSPWVQFGFGKDEIRHLAQELNISIHSKPSLACLSSRIPFNEDITKERLQRIRTAERFIQEELNVRQLRVRDHDGIARIEVGKEEREEFYDKTIMDSIGEKLRSLGFNYVTLDILGYQRGSMLRTASHNKIQRHDRRQENHCNTNEDPCSS